MSKRKIESSPFGLFPDADKKSLEENLFDLLSLYETLVTQSIDLIPDEQKKQEYVAAHKLINDQRQAYKYVSIPNGLSSLFRPTGYPRYGH